MVHIPDGFNLAEIKVFVLLEQNRNSLHLSYLWQASAPVLGLVVVIYGGHRLPAVSDPARPPSAPVVPFLWVLVTLEVLVIGILRLLESETMENLRIKRKKKRKRKKGKERKKGNNLETFCSSDHVFVR
jgi:hypothetical protein